MKVLETKDLAKFLSPYLFSFNVGADEFQRGIAEGTKRIAFSLIKTIAIDNPDLATDIMEKAWERTLTAGKPKEQSKGEGK